MTGKFPTEAQFLKPIDRVIPWVQGEVPVLGLRPGEEQTTMGLAAGRWTLSPRSTLPFVQVRMASAGTRQLTWGESVEVPLGETGTVGNASYHQGNAWLIGQGYAWGYCAPRPCRVTIVQKWFITNPETPITKFVTQWIDTRLARRAYFVQSNIMQDFPYTIRIEEPSGAFQVNNGSSARSITWDQTVIGYRAYVPLGFGSGEQREPAPGINTVQELRPMALLDRARVEIDFAAAGIAGITTATDAFFVLEY